MLRFILDIISPKICYSCKKEWSFICEDCFSKIYDFEEKFKILNSSKLFILPSHEENWAIVIWEAMAIWNPVICYNLPEITPIWQDNVCWINMFDTGMFAQEVLRLLNDEKLMKTMSEKANEFIKKFDWKEIANIELS